jgi:hypothetical protein
MGLGINGVAVAVLAFMLIRGRADSRWGLFAVVVAALSLPALGPVGEFVRTVWSGAAVPLLNSIGTAGAVG